MTTTISRVKQHKRTLINRHTKRDDRKGFTQVVTTLVPLAALWYAAARSTAVSYWLTAGTALLMSLFLLRVFVLMHECGHGSLFHSARLNKTFGFVFGVLSGMPQYVWSEHHAYHHATNGNWAKYRGPLTIATVEEYAAMNHAQQRQYRRARSIWLAPFAGFAYLIFNPRFTWLQGNLALIGHIVRNRVAQPGVSIKAHAAQFKTAHWASAQEYWHMFWNNVVLLSGWVVMSLFLGPELFFMEYITAVSLAGGAGIVLFTVQHNFEHSYASADEGWDYDAAAMHGTSFLILPQWLNWFTANIAYHHIHHLSARIPNYCLVKCHNEYQHLFSDVTRITLSQIPNALKHILWDRHARRIVCVLEYQRRNNQTNYADLTH